MQNKQIKCRTFDSTFRLLRRRCALSLSLWLRRLSFLSFSSRPLFGVHFALSVRARFCSCCCEFNFARSAPLLLYLWVAVGARIPHHLNHAQWVKNLMLLLLLLSPPDSLNDCNVHGKGKVDQEYRRRGAGPDSVHQAAGHLDVHPERLQGTRGRAATLSQAGLCECRGFAVGNGRVHYPKVRRWGKFYSATCESNMFRYSYF